MDSKEIIRIAKQAIDLEMAGVSLMKESLSEDFSKAVSMLNSTEGKIILTGIGKSGHIARKISATFSSTGSPALFVHPAEAIHGDLGIINHNDVILALSNSGNTQELNGIIDYATRFSIKLIAITSNKDSVLGKAANVNLILPKAVEACGIGLAPTTSTTMALVMGDILAVCLIELKGFSAKDFKVFHPGGLIGARLKNISSIMHTEDKIPLVKLGSSIKEAILELSSKRLGCVGIVNGSNQLVGIFTDGDLRRNFATINMESAIDSVMITSFSTIDKNKLASEALRIFNEKHITNMFVIEDKKPIGIIHLHDLLSSGIA